MLSVTRSDGLIVSLTPIAMKTELTLLKFARKAVSVTTHWQGTGPPGEAQLAGVPPGSRFVQPPKRQPSSVPWNAPCPGPRYVGGLFGTQKTCAPVES